MSTHPNEPITSGVLKIEQGEIIFKGLTKREYFAALICASLAGMGDNGYSDYKGNAKFSVEQADALINELNK